MILNIYFFQLITRVGYDILQLSLLALSFKKTDFHKEHLSLQCRWNRGNHPKHMVLFSHLRTYGLGFLYCIYMPLIYDRDGFYQEHCFHLISKTERIEFLISQSKIFRVHLNPSVYQFLKFSTIPLKSMTSSLKYNY